MKYFKVKNAQKRLENAVFCAFFFIKRAVLIRKTKKTKKMKLFFKKVLTNGKVFDIIDRLTSRGDFRLALAL